MCKTIDNIGFPLFITKQKTIHKTTFLYAYSAGGLLETRLSIDGLFIPIFLHSTCMSDDHGILKSCFYER